MSAPLPPSLAQPAIGDGSFPAGTPIAVASPDGAPREVPAESLARGEKVLTLSGPVAVRHVATTRQDPQPATPDHPPRARLIPVRVAASAFGEGQPVADLLLPPEALVHVLDPALPQGALVPLGALVNGASIRREPLAEPVTWVRLELETPGVVIAAGLLVAARIDSAASPPSPYLPAGPAAVGLRQRLAQPAAAPPEPESMPESMPESGTEPAPAAAQEPPSALPAAPPPPAPVLRALAEGDALAMLDDSTNLAWHFALPGGTTLVRLVSPRGVPASLTPLERVTSRRFGVAIRAIAVDDQPVPLNSPAIGDGFHALESAGSETWRWTAGDATLHLPPSPGPRRLTVHITDWHHMLQPDD